MSIVDVTRLLSIILYYTILKYTMLCYTILLTIYSRPDPYGVVLIIGAWNYPLHLSLAPLAGAIAAGNCAVVKPSEISPHTAQAIEQLLTKYLDPECFQVCKR